MDGEIRDPRDEVYSQRVRAGKRTYFFDIKATRGGDFFLVITESRRRSQGERFTYEKHRIFLYKEDLINFREALQDSLDYIQQELMPDVDLNQYASEAVDEDPVPGPPEESDGDYPRSSADD